jgi:hypothetical protein
MTKEFPMTNDETSRQLPFGDSGFGIDSSLVIRHSSFYLTRAQARQH